MSAAGRVGGDYRDTGNFSAVVGDSCEREKSSLESFHIQECESSQISKCSETENA